MISPILFIVFFFILVLFYPAVSLVISVSGWTLRRRRQKRNIKDNTIGETMDKKTDRFKDLGFIGSVLFILFFAAPLAVFYIINIGGVRLISW